MPRSPNPPGTSTPATPRRYLSAPSFSRSSASTRTRFAAQSWAAAAVREGFVDALVGVLKLDVFSDDRDADALFRVDDALDELAPVAHVRLAGAKIQRAADVFVESFGLQIERQLRRSCARHPPPRSLLRQARCKKGELLAHFRVERHLGAANDDLRLKADLPQLGDALLGRFRFQFARRLDVRESA